MKYGEAHYEIACFSGRVFLGVAHCIGIRWSLLGETAQLPEGSFGSAIHILRRRFSVVR